MRTIGIINQKGGCGKTTVSINLAATLAAKGRRTLLVDMDPQSHCALGLAVPDAQIERSMADLLRAGLGGSADFEEVIWQISRGFDLAPASIALAGLEAQLSGAPDRDRRLAQVLSTLEGCYDFCVIDCPPSIGLLTFNALRAADEVLIPVETGYFALQGSVKQEQTIAMLARRAGHHVRFKVLATMYDVRTKLAREILSELRRHFDEQLLPVVINFNSKLKEAASFGQPITEYDAASRGMQDFEQLVQWLTANPPARQAHESGVETGEDGGAESAEAAGGRNPAISRAAELVERARALSARTAALAGKLSTDPDAVVADAAPGAQRHPAVAAEEGRQPAPRLEHQRQHESHSRPTPLHAKLAGHYGVRSTRRGLLFVQPANGARRLAVAGDFNQWDAGQTPMVRDQTLGVWQALVPIPAGRYRYRLIVDGETVADPYNARTEVDALGETSNIVEVAAAEADRADAARRPRKTAAAG